MNDSPAAEQYAHLPGRDTSHDNHKQKSSGKQIRWPGQVQRRDTSYGLDGDGPEPVAN